MSFITNNSLTYLQYKDTANNRIKLQIYRLITAEAFTKKKSSMKRLCLSWEVVTVEEVWVGDDPLMIP